MTLRSIFGFALMLMLFSCVRSPDYSDVPTLNFIGMSKYELNQGAFNQDSVVIEVGFTDGDGDIDLAGQSLVSNLFVIDNRSGVSYPYKVPPIPTTGANQGIKGSLLITVFNTCCIYQNRPSDCEPNTEEPTNALSFDIYLVDRKGNVSDTVTTSPLTLLCN